MSRSSRPEGEEALGKLGIKEEGKLEGIAVDPSGEVWIYRGEEEAGRDRTLQQRRQGTSLKKKGVFRQKWNARNRGLRWQGMAKGSTLATKGSTSKGGCFGIRRRLRSTVAAKLGAHGELVLGALDPEATAGLAVEAASGGTIVDSGSSVAILTRGLSRPALRWGAAAGWRRCGGGRWRRCVRGGQRAGPSRCLQAGGCRRARGRSGGGSESALDLGWRSVRLSARIDPDGADTHYFFQYWAGSVNCASEPGACTDRASAASGG